MRDDILNEIKKFDENLHYEVEMLRFSHDEYLKIPDPNGPRGATGPVSANSVPVGSPDSDKLRYVFLENFLLHLRVLLDFLYKDEFDKRDKNKNGIYFFESFKDISKKSSFIGERDSIMNVPVCIDLKGEVSRRLAHLTKDRRKTNVNWLNDYPNILETIERILELFVKYMK
jgi:hypothetical protein